MLDKQRLRSFLLGGLTGVIAGILLAPKSGREMRGTIRNRAGEARERSRESYFEARENVRERYSASRNTAAPEYSATESATKPATEPEDATRVPEESESASFDTSEAPRERPVLRDVTREAPDGGGEEVGRAEELRRKVKETRENLRARNRGPVEKGNRGGEGEE